MFRKLIPASLVLAVLACNFPAPQPSRPAEPTVSASTPLPDTHMPTEDRPSTESPSTPSGTPIITPSITPTIDPVPVEGYVILTNIQNTSAYYHAVEMLAEYRTAPILAFQDSIFEIEDELNSSVRFAAIMVKPETLEEGFAFDVFTLAKGVVAGYNTDFAYGFITARQPEDMTAYIERVIMYENGSIDINPVSHVLWRTGEGAVSGGEGTHADRMTQEAVNILQELGFSTKRINMDHYEKPEMMETLHPSGLVYFHAHGAPTMIECGLQCQGDAFMRPDAEQLENIRFIFAAACYTASVSTFYNQSLQDMETYNDRASLSDPADSIALGFLRSGALGYIGHMCMWGANDYILAALRALQEDPSRTTGELLQVYYNRPNGPSIIPDSPAPDLIGMDNNRFYYAAVILLGDPAVRIIQESTE